MLDNDLKNIFLAMNKEKIRYIVLRNYLPIDNLNFGDDIDIFVHPIDIEKLKKILIKNGWKLRKIPREDWGHTGAFKISSSCHKVYMLDIQTNLFFSKDRIKIVDKNTIINKRKFLNNSIFAPNEVHGFFLYIFRLALEKDSLNDKHFFQAKILWEKCRENINYLKIIEKDFDHFIYKELIKIINNRELITDREYYKKLAINLRKNYPPCKANSILELWQKLKIRLSQYKNLFNKINLIVFIGVDGSGKTTLINKLREKSPVFKTQLYLGWNNYFFKWIGKLNRRTNFFSKKARKLADRILFFIFHLLLPFDFLIRYLRAKSQAKYGIIISDRYPLPKKNFGIYRKLSLSFTYFLLPRPSMLFIIDADPEKIWKRKKEGNYEKFKAEVERINNANNIFKCKTVIINTDCFIKESFNKTLQELISYLSK